MPKIISPRVASENPLAKLVSDLGNTMFSDTLTPSLKREQMRKAQQEIFGIEDLALQAEGGFSDPRMAARSAILGGLPPEHLGLFESLLASQEYGERDSRVTRALGGIGKYGNTAEAFDIGEQNKLDINTADNENAYRMNELDNETSRSNNAVDNARQFRQFRETPEAAMVDGTPSFVERQNLTQPGTQPALPESQRDPVLLFRQWLTAADSALPTATPEEKRAWAIEQISKGKQNTITVGPDGTVTIGGDPNTNAVTSAFQQKDAAYGDFLMLADNAMKLASNPEAAPLFGPVGQVRHITQNAAQIVQALSQQFGAQNVPDLVTKARQEALARNTDPAVIADLLTFDPRLSEIDVMSKVLLYKMAESMGQKGQGVSDKDVKLAKTMVGDPLTWTTSQADYLARLKTAISVVQDFDDANRDRLRTPRRVRNTVAPPAGASGPGATTIRTYNPATGKLE